MDAHSLEILGLVAGALTTAAFVPQVVRVWRTRSTTDISLAMFLLFSLGVLLWLIYGAAIGSTPVVAANLLTFVLSLSILVAKLRFK